jgi:hypothetical protein
MKEKTILVRLHLCLAAGSAFSAIPAHAAANLVVTVVSGPMKACLGEEISLTYQVENRGDSASDGYEVSLYLSQDKSIEPTVDWLIKKVSVANGLGPGKSRKKTARVTIPNPYFNGPAGKYHYGAAVAAHAKASSKQVDILRYRDNGDGTVSDHKIGAMWQKNDDGTKRTWQEAIDYCVDLSLVEDDDWILPSIDVLGSIVDYGGVPPACEPILQCQGDRYWSSSPFIDAPENAWFVGFFDGPVLPTSKSKYGYARCVRSGP